MDRPVPVRFTPAVAAAARHIAGREGMSLSAWVRKLVDQEIGRREGRCPACGQATDPQAPGGGHGQ
jgi:hypothetical protein